MASSFRCAHMGALLCAAAGALLSLFSLPAISAQRTAVGENVLVGDTSYLYVYPLGDAAAASGVWRHVPEATLGDSWLPVTNTSTSSPSSPSSPSPSPVSVSTVATSLFISAYLEGSASNKALEIFNPSSSSVDLTPYSLRFLLNGGTWADARPLPLSGTLAAKSSLVIANPSSSAALLALASVRSSLLNFNGNDAIGLYQSSDLIDVVGAPAAAMSDFAVAGVAAATKDRTLIRKASVWRGNVDWMASAGKDAASSEWNVLPMDSLTGLGAHVMDPLPVPPAAVAPADTAVRGPRAGMILQLAAPSASFSIGADFAFASSGVYEVYGRVKLSSSASLGDLTFFVNGADGVSDESGTNKAAFPAAVQSQRPRDQWFEFLVATLSVRSASKGYFALVDAGMFVSDMPPFSGYSVDWVKVVKVRELSLPALRILAPFDGQRFAATSVDVSFVVSGLQSLGAFTFAYSLDGGALGSQISGQAGEVFSLTINALSGGRHAVKLVVFSAASAGSEAEVLVSGAVQFDVITPPEPITAMTAVNRTNTVLVLQLETKASGADVLYEVIYRRENDDHSFTAWQSAPISNSTRFVATGLRPAFMYHFCVRVINTVGISEFACAAFRTSGVVRRNAELVSKKDRDQFVRLLHALNKKGTYRQFTLTHAQSMEKPAGTTSANAAHRGPAFLPWHRVFLLELERELQSEAQDASFGLLFWKWDTTRNDVRHQSSNVFAPDFMGGNGIANENLRVREGLFRRCKNEPPIGTKPPKNFNCDVQWAVILPRTNGLFDDAVGLQRDFGRNSPHTSLCTEQQIATLIATEKTYDAAPYNTAATTGFRARLESCHNTVHVYIGGHMLYGTSPNDPLFYLNHINVDRIWADWQIANPTVPYDVTVAANASSPRHPPGHGLNDAMFPWDGVTMRGKIWRPSDVLNNDELGVRYAVFWNSSWDEPQQPLGVRFITNPKLTQGPFAGWQLSPQERAAGASVQARPDVPSLSAASIESVTVWQTLSTPLVAWTTYTLTVELLTSGSYAVRLVVGTGNGTFALLGASVGVGTNSAQNVTIRHVVLSSHRFLGEPLTVQIGAERVSAAQNAAAARVFVLGVRLAAEQTLLSADNNRQVASFAAASRLAAVSAESCPDAPAPSASSSSLNQVVTQNVGMVVGFSVSLVAAIALSGVIGFIVGQRKQDRVQNHRKSLQMIQRDGMMQQDPNWTPSPINAAAVPMPSS